MHIEFGVSRQIVSRWENGVAIPRATKIKTICDEFNISPDTLLGKENIKIQDSEIEKEEIKKPNTIIKRVSIVAVCLLILYMLYFMYKFIIITKINTKMKEYNNWTNYYAEIDTFEDARQVSKIKIWYKDEKYKIVVDYFDKDEEKKETTRYINTKENTRIIVNNGIVKEYNDNYTEDIFSDGKKITRCFPWFYDLNNNILKICLKSILYLKKEKNEIIIKNDKKILKLKQDWSTPISYYDSESEKVTFTDYKIEFDSVKDEDVEIKEDL